MRAPFQFKKTQALLNNLHTVSILHYLASIITLPPVAKWANIHIRSTPLMLHYENKVLTAKWLNKTAEFNEIL